MCACVCVRVCVCTYVLVHVRMYMCGMKSPGTWHVYIWVVRGLSPTSDTSYFLLNSSYFISRISLGKGKHLEQAMLSVLILWSPIL